MATSHVDSYVKQQDEAHRLALLQKNLIAGPNIAQPGRTLIREGYLLKVKLFIDIFLNFQTVI